MQQIQYQQQVKQIINLLQDKSYLENESDKKILFEYIRQFDIFKCPSKQQQMDKSVMESLKYYKVKTIQPKNYVYLYGEQSGNLYFIVKGKAAYYLPKSENQKFLATKFQEINEKNKLTLKSLKQMRQLNLEKLDQLREKYQEEDQSIELITQSDQDVLNEIKEIDEDNKMNSQQQFEQVKQEKKTITKKNLDQDLETEQNLMLDGKILEEKIRVQKEKYEEIQKQIIYQIKEADIDYESSPNSLNAQGNNQLKLIGFKQEQTVFGHHSFFLQNKRWQTVTNYSEKEPLILLELNSKRFHQIFYPVLGDIFSIFETLTDTLKIQKSLADNIALGFEYPEKLSLKESAFQEDTNPTSFCFLKSGMIEFVKRFQMNKDYIKMLQSQQSSDENLSPTTKHFKQKQKQNLEAKTHVIQEKQLQIIQKNTIFGFETLLLQCPMRFCTALSTSFQTYYQKIPALTINKLLQSSPDQNSVRSKSVEILMDLEQIEVKMQKFMPGCIEKTCSDFINAYKIYKNLIDSNKDSYRKKSQQQNEQDNQNKESKQYLSLSPVKRFKQQEKKVYQNTEDSFLVERKQLQLAGEKFTESVIQQFKRMKEHKEGQILKATKKYKQFEEPAIDLEQERIKHEMIKKNTKQSFTSQPHPNQLGQRTPSEELTLPRINKRHLSLEQLHELKHQNNKKSYDLVRKLSSQLFSEKSVNQIINPSSTHVDPVIQMPDINEQLSPLKPKKKFSLLNPALRLSMAETKGPESQQSLNILTSLENSRMFKSKRNKSEAFSYLSSKGYTQQQQFGTSSNLDKPEKPMFSQQEIINTEQSDASAQQYYIQGIQSSNQISYMPQSLSNISGQKYSLKKGPSKYYGVNGKSFGTGKSFNNNDNSLSLKSFDEGDEKDLPSVKTIHSIKKREQQYVPNSGRRIKQQSLQSEKDISKSSISRSYINKQYIDDSKPIELDQQSISPDRHWLRQEGAFGSTFKFKLDILSNQINQQLKEKSALNEKINNRLI